MRLIDKFFKVKFKIQECQDDLFFNNDDDDDEDSGDQMEDETRCTGE